MLDTRSHYWVNAAGAGQLAVDCIAMAQNNPARKGDDDEFLNLAKNQSRIAASYAIKILDSYKEI